MASLLTAFLAWTALLGSATVAPPDAKSQALAELGRTLFFDTRLSFNDSVSCATCHQPEKGFGDGQRFSRGAAGNTLKRHTPQLYNLDRATSFFWDGRASSLEEQALMPIQSPDEMNLPIEAMVRKLEAVDYYRAGFEDLFPQRGLSGENVARAIASFERTLVSRDSPYDLDRLDRRDRSGDGAAMSDSARSGAKLFFGRARCSRCHKGEDFTDRGFHNTGIVGEDPGRAVLDRVGLFQMRPYPFFQTQKAFKTPGLRNAALSPPYFHDGSEPTLDAVVRFYNQGGKDRESYGLSPDVRPLELDESAISDLVAFLLSLTAPVAVERPAIPD